MSNSNSGFNEPQTYTLADIHRLNGWEKILTDHEDGILIFPADRYMIDLYNREIALHLKAPGSSKFYTDIVPEPWYGNPITASIIVLSDMPIYDYFINRSANVLTDPRYKEQVFVGYIERWWKLMEYSHIYKEEDMIPYFSANFMDCYNSQLYRHWIKEFTRIANEHNIPQQQIFDRLAVINANPYYSDNNTPLSAGLLPSHYFIRTLIRFLLNQEFPPTIIIPSSDLEKTWSVILGDIWPNLSEYACVLRSDRHNYQRLLTPHSMGEDYEELLLHLE